MRPPRLNWERLLLAEIAGLNELLTVFFFFKQKTAYEIPTCPQQIGRTATRPLFCRRRFCHESLVWLEGFPSEISVDLAQLGSLSDVALVSRLRVLALHFDHLIE